MLLFYLLQSAWKVKYPSQKSSNPSIPATPEIWFGLGARYPGQTYENWIPFSTKFFDLLKAEAEDKNLLRKVVSLLSIRGNANVVPLLDGTTEAATRIGGLLCVENQILQLDDNSNIRFHLGPTNTFTESPSKGILTEHVLSLVDTSFDMEEDDGDASVFHIPSSVDPGMRRFNHVFGCDLIDAVDKQAGLALYVTVRLLKNH